MRIILAVELARNSFPGRSRAGVKKKEEGQLTSQEEARRAKQKETGLDAPTMCLFVLRSRSDIKREQKCK